MGDAHASTDPKPLPSPLAGPTRLHTAHFLQRPTGQPGHGRQGRNGQGQVTGHLRVCREKQSCSRPGTGTGWHVPNLGRLYHSHSNSP